MASRADLPEWVLAALETLGGRGTVLEVSKTVWQQREEELRASGDLFFTWQYDIRWAATKLRKRGKLQPASSTPSGVWALQK
jgi:hypothetical protein